MSNAGLILRKAVPADAQGIAAVRVDSWRATYRGIIPDAYLDGMRVEESKALWARVLQAEAVAVFVVERGGEIVGFAAGNTLAESKHGLDSELTAIYLRPEVQRAGVGRRLVGLVAETHRTAGATGMIVWVLSGNRAARDFYADLGAELLVEQAFKWDELELMEAGYGWRDLDALLQACGK